MATETQQQRLRLDLGLAATDTTNLPNATIDAIYTEVEEQYTDANSIHAATRVLAIDRLLMQAASDVDYTQNNTTEKSSQRHAMLEKERLKWEKKLTEAIAAASTTGSARFGRPTRKPTRIKEFPGW